MIVSNRMRDRKRKKGRAAVALVVEVDETMGVVFTCSCFTTNMY